MTQKNKKKNTVPFSSSFIHLMKFTWKQFLASVSLARLLLLALGNMKDLVGFWKRWWLKQLGKGYWNRPNKTVSPYFSVSHDTQESKFEALALGHPSIIFSLSRVVSLWQQVQQGHLCSWPHSFSHYAKVMTICEERNVDWPVTWKQQPAHLMSSTTVFLIHHLVCLYKIFWTGFMYKNSQSWKSIFLNDICDHFLTCHHYRKCIYSYLTKADSSL